MRLVAPDPDETLTGEAGYDAGACCGLALTKLGRIAVYTAHCNQRFPGTLEVFTSLDDTGLPVDIEADAARALGQEHVIYRDI